MATPQTEQTMEKEAGPVEKSIFPSSSGLEQKRGSGVDLGVESANQREEATPSPEKKGQEMEEK